LKLSAHRHSQKKKASGSTTDLPAAVASSGSDLMVHDSESEASFIAQLKREAAGYGPVGLGGARYVVDENVPTPNPTMPTMPPPPTPEPLSACRPRGWDPQVIANMSPYHTCCSPCLLQTHMLFPLSIANMFPYHTYCSPCLLTRGAVCTSHCRLSTPHPHCSCHTASPSYSLPHLRTLPYHTYCSPCLLRTLPCFCSSGS
jgi:hypothetical protein